MIKPEMVPPDAMYAAWKCMNAGMTLNDAIAAALNAWPGMHTHEWQRPWLGGMSGTDLILPLPNETADQRPRRTLNELRGVFAEAYKSNREPR